MLEPRYYQKNAVEELKKRWAEEPIPRVVIAAPTGSGKSVIIALICEAFPTDRILILSHVKELLTQDASKIDETGIIEITLPNNHGGESSLSSLRGNVVLLDFHVYAADGSTERIMALRELYNTFHDKGFDIYQVSFDDDEHFWKTQTSALPWTCVRAGEKAEDIMQLYNITSVPMYYLLDRDCNVSLRDAQVKDIKQSIASLLQ